MFGLFSSKNDKPPIDEETRKWMENAFAWLLQEFNSTPVKQRKIFTPSKEDFPYLFDGKEEVGTKTALIVSRAMEIDASLFKINYFDNGIREFNTGASIIFTQNDKEKPNAAGLYFEKDKDGIYQIGLDNALLTQPENLVSTLAHEFSHLKLLGEKQLDFNDEYLTDLSTVVFGFGIFNANTAFQFSTSFDRWGYSNSGYLTQMEWGYALALLAYVREEDNPDWIQYLNKNIQSDFKQSIAFMLANEDLLFKYDN